MTYQVTVRYGTTRKRYHLFTVEAAGVAEALSLASRSLPDEVAEAADLVELREATKPDDRSYVDEA